MRNDSEITNNENELYLIHDLHGVKLLMQVYFCLLSTDLIDTIINYVDT